MFKNLTVYRLAPTWTPDAAQLEEALSRARFVPCGATQQQSSGWVEPRGIAHAPLLERVDGHWLLKLQVEQRVLPGSVVKRRVEEICQQIEQATGRKPGKKQSKEIKEQAMLELLPMAFTKQGSIPVWICPAQRLMMIDSGSQGRADEVVAQLVKALDGLVVAHVNTQVSPAVAMSQWLLEGEAPAGFSIDRECELKSADEMKSVVRYARHPLDTDEVRQHVAMGKVPTRLALTWEGRVSFTLTQALQIKKLGFLDVVFEDRPAVSRSDSNEAFDADAAIATGELIQLIPDLIEALGGELPMPGEREGAVPARAGAGPSSGTSAVASAEALAQTPAARSVAPWDDEPPVRREAA